MSVDLQDERASAWSGLYCWNATVPRDEFTRIQDPSPGAYMRYGQGETIKMQNVNDENWFLLPEAQIDASGGAGSGGDGGGFSVVSLMQGATPRSGRWELRERKLKPDSKYQEVYEKRKAREEREVEEEIARERAEEVALWALKTLRGELPSSLAEFFRSGVDRGLTGGEDGSGDPDDALFRA